MLAQHRIEPKVVGEEGSAVGSFEREASDFPCRAEFRKYYRNSGMFQLIYLLLSGVTRWSIPLSILFSQKICEVG